MSNFNMKQLLEAGLHYGHQTRRWNPKMAPYIFGERNGIHILDLEKTVPLLHHALKALTDVVARGGRVLLVGTKQQASDPVRKSAELCGQYYINHRWLGGLLTNWKTINQSIKRLRDLESELTSPEGLKKKEVMKIKRDHDKLVRAIGGIREMGGLPDIVVVIDTNREKIAIQEANRLKIPVIALIDSNSDPEGIQYAIPGNDDAIRSIQLFCDLIVEAVLEGLRSEVAASGIDVGSSEDPGAKRRS